jgi:hypothetical protein
MAADHRPIYLTDYGPLFVSAAELGEAGVRFRADGRTIVYDKRGQLLHDFLTLYMRDQRFRGVAPTPMHLRS